MLSTRAIQDTPISNIHFPRPLVGPFGTLFVYFALHSEERFFKSTRKSCSPLTDFFSEDPGIFALLPFLCYINPVAPRLPPFFLFLSLPPSLARAFSGPFASVLPKFSLLHPCRTLPLSTAPGFREMAILLLIISLSIFSSRIFHKWSIISQPPISSTPTSRQLASLPPDCFPFRLFPGPPVLSTVVAFYFLGFRSLTVPFFARALILKIAFKAHYVSCRLDLLLPSPFSVDRSCSSSQD